MRKIAVLLTCHNRNEKTLNCLKSLYNAIDHTDRNIRCDIYLVNDGSTDGTVEEVTIHFPEVHVIEGSGNLYWSGGMRLAWETALANNETYDSFLLLNDDVTLLKNSITVLLDTHEYCLGHYGQSGIYVLSTSSDASSELSYGGTVIIKKGITIKKSRVSPSKIPVPCSMANANILMVTKSVVEKIGVLDKRFIHRFADYDLTLTATENGIPVLVCPGIGGYCINDNPKGWLSAGTSFKERLKYLYSAKGLSYKEQLYYLKKHFKFQVPYYFIMLWLKTFFPVFWDKFKKGTK